MLAYRKERIENALLFFASEHYNKTKKFLSQTALYKYLAFFEFRFLEKYGEMPLELQYQAMEHGPVPVEIYRNRNELRITSVLFEEKKSSQGKPIVIVKPNAKFNKDYFSEDELQEMQNLIEFFAQRWVEASVMSDASHREIQAWRKTYKASPNALIDPADDFSRDILSLPVEELDSAEERFVRHKKMMEFINAR